MPAKRGRWSKQEEEFIREHAAKLTVEHIAAHLNRNPDSVGDWVEKNVPMAERLQVPPPPPPTPPAPAKPAAPPELPVDDEAFQKSAIRAELRNSLAWKKLKDEFTKDELAYFEEEYVGLVSQFQEDVFHTEEQQIRKAITLDILMRRNLVMRKKALEDIARLERMQAGAVKRYEETKDKLPHEAQQEKEEWLLNLETQIQAAKAAEQSKTKEYSDLDTRHQKLMEALKATREQRISKVESSKQTFLGVLRELDAEERRKAEGRQIDLMSRATEAEYRRLAGVHTYDDGNQDQPILSAETVEMLDAQHPPEEDE